MDLPNLSGITFDDLGPLSVPVVIKSEGKETRYELREASADAAMKYRDVAVQSSRWKDGEMVGFDGMARSQVVLVANCLFEPHDTTPKNGWRNVGEALVRSWPERVVKALFERVKELSPCLEEVETEETIGGKIEELQRRLEKFRKARAKGKEPELPKGGPTGTEAT